MRNQATNKEPLHLLPAGAVPGKVELSIVVPGAE